MSSITKRRTSAFTLAEVLITIGVIFVLISLALPGIMGSRKKARSLVSMSNIRQHGTLVAAYASDWRDVPPALFKPILSLYPDGPWQTVEVEGESIKGSWFQNAHSYHALLDRESVSGIAFDPSRPSSLPDTYSRKSFGDYSIAQCFYASPDYWDRWSQRGAVQFALQRMTSVTFPSQKGLLHQSVVYSIKGFPDGYGACCDHSEPASIQWADGSVSFEAISALLPGEPNFYHYGSLAPPTFWSTGTPIDATKHGVFGRDR